MVVATTPVDSKLAHLHRLLGAHERVMVAFSGGVDSAFLLKAAVDALGDRAYAVTAISPTMARSEARDAEALGRELGLGDRHTMAPSHELARPGFADNPTDRCAMCKSELMEIARPLAASLGISAIALGTNLDDLGDVRPGIAAATSHGAIMPLVDAGYYKHEIRATSQRLGLRTWDKPQLACLSSRFPYGTRITTDRLAQVDGFEDGLRALGFGQLRVRFHEQVARLELDAAGMARLADEALRQQIVALGKQHGFTYIALDLQGFRSGSLNEAVAPALIQLARRGARVEP